MTLPVFKVGDRVTWTSQAAGRWLNKAGKVVAVVPPRSSPVRAMDAAGVIGHVDVSCIDRNHESYVVRVKGTRGGSKLYWPRVAGLRAVADDPGIDENLLTAIRSRATAGWNRSDRVDIGTDALYLLSEVDRLRALLEAKS